MSADAVMPLRDVKNHLSEVVGQVEREHSRVTITRHGRPAAVVISPDDLGSLEETLDILSRPALIERIRAGVDDLGAQRVETLSKDELLDFLEG
ncbi:type II toxin-antitoxin system Phd/YefM family antitoxin [Actinomyces sp.]|uniref:type II toxin-antitoxin system Phd/YefM family antitoxin n=1 Tax=Actinomyces sp. TaxID=29317 RepID=UPI0026DAA186|nr:type II toxin-antitoxin system Phd/YefM family antitoxin [Actinomyces sp.]MDO4901301.1 type II toxin-antitoxin system Phd/YefM family antitoxin [Actinomyces sp.]